MTEVKIGLAAVALVEFVLRSINGLAFLPGGVEDALVEFGLIVATFAVLRGAWKKARAFFRKADHAYDVLMKGEERFERIEGRQDRMQSSLELMADEERQHIHRMILSSAPERRSPLDRRDDDLPPP
jgi:hypothetical protein